MSKRDGLRMGAARVSDDTREQIERIARRVGRTASIDLSLWLSLVKKVDDEIGVNAMEAFRQQDGTFGIRVKPERAQRKLEELLKLKRQAADRSIDLRHIPRLISRALSIDNLDSWKRTNTYSETIGSRLLGMGAQVILPESQERAHLPETSQSNM